MLFSAGVTISLLSSLVAAQDYGYGGGGGGSPPTTASSSAAPIPTAPADTDGHKNIDVAKGAFIFSPANITAPNGTTVTFWFPNNGLDHSVTQSSFANPCTYLEASANNTAGFDSGLTNSKQFTITITDDTKPIWFHCKQVGHCGQGMVGSINAATTATGNTFDKFMAAAKAIGSSEVQEIDHGPVTSGFNAIANGTPAATGAGAVQSQQQDKGGAGIRVGVSVGAGMFAAAMAVIVAYY